ncbi:LysR family transcriptional regulator [Kiloniella majae]|uniref:LysR family transcriptional regulator n=1 Tax=Kiloniella majae TaxID=1938558 RepID=UPI000A277B4C|nr:LysR family transcriptional regulator [Kiloniella majae]
MTSKLPPLSSLRVFEAAARHGSFTRASEELGMTQAAVSYQMKILEERVGTALFLRKPRQVSLTETGRRIAPVITEAFELLRSAFVMAEDSSQRLLSITAVTTFAASFLAERMGSFQIKHDDLAVRLDTSLPLVDFTREEFDVGIRSGGGSWDGLESHFLIPCDFTPLVNPELAESIGGIHQPSDLLKLPLVGISDPWWRSWFEAVGLPTDDLKCRQKSGMMLQLLEARAAEAGQGVAILTPAFFRDSLKRGTLMQPFDKLCRDEGYGYWLAYPKARRNVPKIKKFREWLLAEIKEFNAREEVIIQEMRDSGQLISL